MCVEGRTGRLLFRCGEREANLIKILCSVTQLHTVWEFGLLAPCTINRINVCPRIGRTKIRLTGRSPGPRNLFYFCRSRKECL